MEVCDDTTKQSWAVYCSKKMDYYYWINIGRAKTSNISLLNVHLPTDVAYFCVPNAFWHEH